MLIKKEGFLKCFINSYLDITPRSNETVTSYKLQVTSYKLQVTSYELRVTSYKLQVTSYKLQVTNYLAMVVVVPQEVMRQLMKTAFGVKFKPYSPFD